MTPSSVRCSRWNTCPPPVSAMLFDTMTKVFAPVPLPPAFGTEWQPRQLCSLKRAPTPSCASQARENCLRPSAKIFLSAAVASALGSPNPRPSLCAAAIPIKAITASAASEASLNLVIPGLAAGRGPESMNTGLWENGFRARRCAATRNDNLCGIPPE